MRQIDHVCIPDGCCACTASRCVWNRTDSLMVVPMAGGKDDRRAREVYQGHAPSHDGTDL
eukprot:1999224-Rhodomonas_salina.1